MGSNTVANKVVEMQFDNKDFEKNVEQSMKTLERLEKALDLQNASKAFDQLDRSASKINLDHISQSVDKIADKFTFFGKVTQKAMDGIISYAANVGKSIYNSTIGQIKTGGMTRALNIAQAKFQLEGLKVAWEEVSGAIDYAVDGTAYGLDSAAKAASQLSASGIKAEEDMKKALRGISGVAAMTNSEYDDIARIFTTIAGNGRVMTMQLNQLGMRGINAAAELAKAFGVTEAELREMVTHGEVDFVSFARAMDDAFGAHAKDANKTFTGAMSNVRAALSRVGALFATTFIDQMVTPLNSLRIGINALKDALVPLSQIFEVLMMRFSRFAGSLVETDGDIVKLNDKLLNSINNSVQIVMNIFRALASLLAPIENAFHDVFSRITLSSIENLTGTIVRFTDKLTLSGESMEKVRSIFRAFFSVIDLGIDTVGKILARLLPFGSSLGNIGGTALTVAANFGDFITCLVQFIKESDFVNKGIDLMASGITILIGAITNGIENVKLFLKTLSEIPLVQQIAHVAFTSIVVVIAAVVVAVQGLSIAIRKLIDLIRNIKLSDIKILLDKVYSGLLKIKEVLETAITSIINFGKNIVDSVSKFKSFGEAIESLNIKLGQFVGNIKNFLGSIINFKNKVEPTMEATTLVYKKQEGSVVTLTDTIKKKFETFNWGSLVVAAFGVAVTVAVSRIGKAFQSFGRLAGSVSSLFGLKPLINEIQAGIKMGNVVKIANAIAIVAASLAALTLVDSDKLMNASAALSQIVIVMGGMLALLLYMSRFDMVNSFVKNVNAIVAMSGSLLILALAVRSLEGIGWTSIGKALGTFTAMLILLGGAAIVLARLAPSLSTGALSIVAFAGGVYLLSRALGEIQQTVDVHMGMEVIKGLIAIVASVGVLALAASRITLTGALGIIALAAGIKLLNQSLLDIATYGIRLEVIKQNIDKYVVVFGSIVILAAAIRLAGASALQASAGLLLITVVIRRLMDLMVDLANLEVTVDMNLLKRLAIVIGSVGALLLATRLAGDHAIKAGIAALLISGAVAAIGMVFKAISDMDNFNVPVAWFIGGLVALFGGLVAVTALTAKAKLAPIIAMIAGIGVITTSLAVLSILGENVVWAAVSLAGGLMAFGFSMMAVSTACEKIKIIPIVEMLVTLAAAAGSIYILATLPWEGLLAAGGALSMLLLVMAGAVNILGNAQMSLTAALAIDLIAIALIPMAYALQKIAEVDSGALTKNLIALGVAIGVLVGLGAIVSTFAPIAVGLGVILAALLALAEISGIFAEAASQLADGLGVMAVNLKALSDVAPDAARNIGQALEDIGASIGKAGANIVTNFVGGITKGFAQGISAIISGVNSFSGPLINVGKTVVTFLAKGLSLFSSVPIDRMTKLTGDIVNAYKNGTEKPLENAGKDGLKGLSLGFQDSGALGELWGSITNVANGIVSTFAGIVGWHSPWQIFIDAAKDGISAITNTFSASKDKVFEAAKGIGSGIKDATGKWGWSEIGSSIKGFLDEHVLKPIGDAKNKAFGQFNSLLNMFNGTTLALQRIHESNMKYLQETKSVSMGDFRMLENNVDIVQKRSETSAQLMMANANLLGNLNSALGDGGSGKGTSGAAKEAEKEVKKLWNTMESGKSVIDGITKRLVADTDIFSSKSALTIDLVSNNLDRFGSNVQDVFKKMLKDTENSVDGIGEYFDKLTDGDILDFDAFEKLRKTTHDGLTLIEEDYKNLWNEMFNDFTTKAVDNFAEHILITSDKYTEEIQKMDKNSEEYLGAMQEAWEEYTKKIEDAFKMDVFSENERNFAASIKDITSNINNNMSIVEDYGRTFDRLALRFARENWDTTILEQWAEEGYTSFDKISMAMQATRAEMREMLDAYHRTDEAAKGMANTILQDLTMAVGTNIEYTKDWQEQNMSFSFSLDQLGDKVEDLSVIIKNRYEEMYSAIYKTLQAQIDIFSEYSDEEDDALDPSTIQDYANSQVAHVTKVTNAWDKLLEKNPSDELVRKLVEMGSSGEKELFAIAEMSEEQFQTYSETIEKIMTMEKESADRIATRYSVAGEGAIKAFVDAIDPNGAVENMEQLVKNAVNKGVELAPLAYGPGQQVAEKLAEGITKNEKVTTSASKEMGTNIVKVLNESLPESKVKEIGVNLNKGLAKGITENSRIVTGAVERLMAQVKKTAEDAVEEKSPSKWAMRVGRYIDQGLAFGIEDGTKEAVDSIADLGYESISAMEKVIDHIYDIVTGDINIDPTIRPTVDMSDIDAALPYINGVFADRSMQLTRGLGAIRTYNGNYNGESVAQNGNSTTQNITMNVYGAEGQDVDELATIISHKLSREVSRYIG